MAANTSQRKARAIVMGAPVERHHAHELILECRPCDRRDQLPLTGYDALTVGEVLAGLRCPACAREPSVVTLTDRDGRRPVRLLGPGAFG